MRGFSVFFVLLLTWGISVNLIFSTLLFDDKEHILDIHNWIRSEVAAGFFNLPPVNNMLAMEWSDDLESEAKKLNTECNTEKMSVNKTKDDEGYLMIKKNAHEINESSIGYNMIREILTSINSSLTTNCVDLDGSCQVISQVLEPSVSAMGCSLKDCKRSDYVLICVYNSRPSTAALIQRRQLGDPCTNCPTNRAFCLDHSLCATEFQCSRSCAKTCVCTLSQENCLNNGFFVESRCLCLCKNGYHGIFCEDRCSDKWSTCKKNKNKCDAKRKKNSQFILNCQKTCGYCVEIPFESTRRHKSVSPSISTTHPDKNKKCKDRRWKCPSWASQRLCFLKTVRNDCLWSCSKCKSDKDLIKNITNNNEPNIDGKECVDKKPECEKWSETGHCIIQLVQLSCPKSCGMCPDPPDIVDLGCKEDAGRAATCKEIRRRYLCYSPDMKEVCPVTCGNIKCGKPLPTTTLSDPCLEPESHKKPCQDFKEAQYCSEKDIKSYCPITCRKRKCGKDPVMCKGMKKLCSVLDFALKCQETCADPESCRDLSKLCLNPIVREKCKLTCHVQGTKKSTKSKISKSTLTTGFSTENPVCSTLKNLCHDSSIAAACKVTCATTSTIVYSKSSKIPPSTEPKICLGLKDFCSSPRIKHMCKTTCQTTQTVTTPCSTALRSDELDECSVMAPHCSNPGVKELCPFTCGACGPTVVPHTEEPSSDGP